MSNRNRSIEKEQFWRLVLDEQASSGMSVRAFCRRESISEPSFYAWRRELARRDGKTPSNKDKSAIVPVRVVNSESTADKDCTTEADLSEQTIIEVVTPNGFTFRAAVATDAHHISTWLSAITKATQS